VGISYGEQSKKDRIAKPSPEENEGGKRECARRGRGAIQIAKKLME